MQYKILIQIPKIDDIILELDDQCSPKTVRSFVDKLPFTVKLNVWGEEIYSSESPIYVSEENSKSVVSLNDVAYWPLGKAICLFYGPTPISNKGKIIPASPVNIIGKIVAADKTILKKIEGTNVTFRLSC